ncbi:hypothetical protein EC960932_3703, partial [Escherichia coli 96.0932]
MGYAPRESPVWYPE